MLSLPMHLPLGDLLKPCLRGLDTSQNFAFFPGTSGKKQLAKPMQTLLGIILPTALIAVSKKPEGFLTTHPDILHSRLFRNQLNTLLTIN